ncbi:methyltransferase domain-containing protein [Compostimonas suwonensis]|uniref:Methyltransferase family protein n=1 Tax=Compostimonas suwonensis TaxID=1048394 RepID=A0A2M9BZH7_9MICO|nr:methyltransferase domain-containing protein [Compostimonas suwonensis]PJJ63470.1 methyltransferase family protein [Compostimonas suwonensis]
MAIQERYTHGHHESVLRSHSWRTVENSAAYLAPRLRSGQDVLDVGSGPGTLSVSLASYVSPGRVVGVDSSDDIVEQARAFAESAGVDNVTFQTGNAYALDIEDDTFDVVHAHQVLQHVADPVAVLKEMRRVVKPGGIVAARDVDYAGTIWYPQIDALDRWQDTLLEVHRANGGDPRAGRMIKSWALDAGFSSVESSASIWSFASDAEREWWGGSWAERVLESDFAPRSIELGLATLDDLRTMSAGWLEWVAAANGTFLMPHGEIIAVK